MHAGSGASGIASGASAAGASVDAVGRSSKPQPAAAISTNHRRMSISLPTIAVEKAPSLPVGGKVAPFQVVSERPSQEGKLSPGAPNDPVPFGRYYLLGLIARGGMAEVYRAKPQDGLKRLLAVKVMRPQLAREARFVDMFHREGKLAMVLKNRCIVETVEIGQHEGRHFITMEYVAGRDLTQVLRRCQETQQRIPVPHAVYIAARIAEGLHFAHTLAGPDGRPLNIVNRDVSPSNVRMSYDGDVKLLDFGIAQALMKFTSEIGILKG